MTQHETPPREMAAPLVDHFFRHESGRLAAVLTRMFGWRHFDLVEDTIQSALVTALATWRKQGVPDNPAAWVRRVAVNRVRDVLRRKKAFRRVAAAWAEARESAGAPIEELFQDSQIEDSQLRMIFACCHPLLSRENQIALTLGALCGFSNAEIASALLLREETVKKRVYRARQFLAKHHVSLEAPAADELAGRLDVVHQVLYLMFNEGYSASRGEEPLRAELCEEAARLCHLLCSHEHARQPATFALLALMLFHAARLESRIDSRGSLLLLEDQDRRLWDRRMMAKATEFLNLSAEGPRVTPYHIEAGICMLHCAAPSFAETDWPAILGLYDRLLSLSRSPVYVLNRSIVVAQIDGPLAGIRALAEALDDPALAEYHLLDCTLGELHRRAGDMASARRHFEAARRKTASRFDRELIDRRLASCG